MQSLVSLAGFSVFCEIFPFHAEFFKTNDLIVHDILKTSKMRWNYI